MPSPQHHEKEQPKAKSNKYEHFILDNENEMRKTWLRIRTHHKYIHTHTVTHITKWEQ